MLTLQPIVFVIASDPQFVDEFVQFLEAHHFFAFGLTTISQATHSLDLLLAKAIVMKPTDDEGFAFLHDLHSQCRSIHVIVLSESEVAAQKAREIGIDNVIEDVAGIVHILAALIPPEPESESRTRLVVDDDEDIADMLSVGLRRNGYGVVTARSGSEALAMVEQDPTIALVVLEFILPKIRDIEVLMRIRERRPEDWHHCGQSCDGSRSCPSSGRAWGV